MSNSTKAAPTPAADVSAEYIASIRLRVRMTASKLDSEIEDLIKAARADLVDPLVKQAIATYVKAEFGLDNEDAEKYRASYDKQKIALGLASSYIEPTEEV